jgi:hypothetical protein
MPPNPLYTDWAEDARRRILNMMRKKIIMKSLFTPPLAYLTQSTLCFPENSLKA